MKKEVLAFAREKQSPHTSFFHGDPEGHTISVLENFGFIYALLVSHLKENVLEAKELIDKLLAFQIKKGVDQGNFPIYLHQYPKCWNRYLSLEVGIYLYHIYREFGFVLQKKKELLESLTHICTYGKEHEERFSLLEKFRLYALASLLREISGEKLIEEEKKQKWEEEIEKALLGFSAKQWGHFLLTVQLYDPEMKGEKTKSYLEKLKKVYHPFLNFTGPAYEELQKGSFPKKTLLDRFFIDGPLDQDLFFSSLLVKKIEGFFIDPSIEEYEEIKKEEGIWKTFKRENYSFSLLEKNLSSPKESEEVSYSEGAKLKKGEHLFRLLWEGEKGVNSLVCEENREIRGKKTSEGVELIYTLSQEVEPFALSFYANFLKGRSISVNGERATVFSLGDEIQIETEKRKVKLQFTPISGDGSFMGHLCFEKRPSQLEEDFDWKIAIRETQRGSVEKILVKIEIR